jgi:tetratricopeptide (TPR) repeat protein
MKGSSKSNLLICCLLIAFSFAAYWQVHGLQFVYFDDPQYTVGNLWVSKGLSWSNVAYALTASVNANWHPVTLLSHMADCQLFGMAPAGHHLTSLVIHTINVLLLFWVLQLATAMVWRSAFVAALFAVHPLNVESVAWIAERKNVLSTMFFLLAIWAYIWYTRAPNWKRYLAFTDLFALGLMAKPMLVTFPFVLLLIDFWPLDRLGLRRSGDPPLDAQPEQAAGGTGPAPAVRRQTIWHLVLEKIPLVLLSALSAVMTVRFQRDAGSVVSITRVPIAERIGNALASYAIYLEKTVWPSKLAAYYPYHFGAVTKWELGLLAIGLLAVSVLAVAIRSRMGFVTFGWFWYLGTLVPVIGLIQVGGQSRADRYAYVPLIGIFVLVVWGVSEAGSRLGLARAGLLGAGLFVLLALAVATRRQVGFWHDTFTLFKHTEQVTGPNWMASQVLGDTYVLSGDFDQAIKEFSKFDAAISEYHWDRGDWPAEPLDDHLQQELGVSCLQNGETARAIVHFKRAIEADPKSSEAYNKLGLALTDAGYCDEAIPCFRRSLELRPGYPPVYANLGNLFEQTGRPDKAITYYNRALELIAYDPVSRNGGGAKSLAAEINWRIGDLLVRGGDPQGARDHYAEALSLQPDSANARRGLDSVSKKPQ